MVPMELAMASTGRIQRELHF